MLINVTSKYVPLSYVYIFPFCMKFANMHMPWDSQDQIFVYVCTAKSHSSITFWQRDMQANAAVF